MGVFYLDRRRTWTINRSMANKIFDRILIQGINQGQIPARTKAAREWFRNRARRSTTAIPSDIVKSVTPQQRVKAPEIGKMYMFNYDPKFKDDDKILPYYDRFPAVIISDYTNNGFYGLNFHYLPLKPRAVLLDALYTVTTDKRYDKNTRFRASYQLLSGASKYDEFAPTFKRYLNSKVRGQLIEIFPSDWDIAMFLPVEQFKKAGIRKVWADSRKIIAKRKGRP